MATQDPRGIISLLNATQNSWQEFKAANTHEVAFRQLTRPSYGHW